VAESRQTRATLRDFLAARGSSASSITLTPDASSSPPGGAFNEGDDLGVDPNTAEPLLGLDGLAAAYVAFLTQQSGNLYEITPQGEEAPTSNRGDQLQDPSQQGAARVFVRPGTTLGQAMQLSNSGIQDATDYPIASYLDKTGGNPDLSGDGLLASVAGRRLDLTGNPEIDTPVNTATQSGKMQTGVLQTLDNNNRAAPPIEPGSLSTVAIPNRITINEIDQQPLQSAQRAFGDYDKDDGATSQAYTYDRLRNVGAWLIASAAGYNMPAGENEPQDIEQFFTQGINPDARISTVANQLATKRGNDTITQDDTVASNAPGYPKQASGASMRADRGVVKPPDEDAPYSEQTTTSYTSETPFSDTSRQGNAKLAQAKALLAINRLAELVNADLVQDPQGALGLTSELKSLGPYFMGGSIYGRVNAMHRMILGVTYVPTRNAYKDAVVAGMGVMLGKDLSSGGTPRQIGDYYGAMPVSPGFWEAVAKSAVDTIRQMRVTGDIADALSPQYYVDLSRSKAVKMMNAFATVGDIILQVTGKTFDPETIGSDIRTAAGIEQVDDLPVTAGTRISKSREGSGRSPLALSWRGSSLPGLYMLSDDVVRASLQMGNLLTGENPARGMLASSLIDKTYTDPTLKGSKARIPGDIVKIIEDKLDAEYVPFYFHDLRTNEIISFHAFLEQLSDTFAANYSSYKTYGRADPIQMYSSTTRTLSLSFTIAATSRDDFDEMWYKVNRLIASTYPKYTKGQSVENLASGIKFEQPFSQVIGATPITRLRIGDVVKSNYSRFNLARFFGIGSEGTDVSNFGNGKSQVTLSNAIAASGGISSIGKSVLKGAVGFGPLAESLSMIKFYALFGSPVKSVAAAAGRGETNSGNVINTTVTNVVSNFLVNGFVNPLGYGLMTAFTQNPDNTSTTDLEGIVGLSDIQGTQNRGFAPNLTIAYLKPRERAYDTVDATGNIIGKFTARRSLKVFVLRQEPTTNRSTFRDPPWGTINAIADEDTPTRETRYIVSVVDPSQFIPIKRDGESDNATGERILVTHDDLQPDLGSVFSPAALIINPAETLLDALLTGADTVAAVGNLNVSSLIDNATDTGVKGFMSPENNTIVRSFEHNKGRGLAGVIKQLTFNWIDFNWETDWGARAPMGTKVTISFECIHDLPPGLDESGYMRAPTHNVGSIMNTIAGDPYDDGGAISRANFSRQGASSVVKK
jgi:hypothetical protein